MTTERFEELLDAYGECAVDNYLEGDRGSQSRENYREIEKERQKILRDLLEIAGLREIGAKA